ncbi:DUF4347 domain-containing protein [Maridesulfovibrio sp.]|uniref:DUF4347 domain-containing protein n=1 Tax=Maridesulfovibrio sp. TaxID=2795000 RepID=UPI002A18E697|nr:DUF4347 domain-containing protein [Maridesulfovibrio sp.]
MRLEERIVLDGAAAVVVEQAAQAMADAHIVDNTADANATQDSHAEHDAKDTAKADSGSAETAEAPDVAALLKAVAPQGNQPVGVAPAKDNTATAVLKDNSQPEEDPVTVLVASSGLADVNDLLGAAKENVVTVTYDGDSANPDDIFNKIESALDGKQAASIGFASHSIGSGSIHLGGDYSVDADTLLSNLEMTEFWKNVGSLVESDGHIDLLGCGVAGGEVGKDFIAKLEQITGREIAASIDDTGNTEAGGNWLLEEGGVDLAQVYFDSGKLGEFDGVLATDSIIINLNYGGTPQTLYDVDGDGYYEIDTTEKLVALSQTTNKTADWSRNYELTGDIRFSSDVLSVDWDGDGMPSDMIGFRPIGYHTGNKASFEGTAFSGKFNGNDHTIYNLYTNRKLYYYTGLFGYVENAKIFALNVTGTIYGRTYTGGLVGKATNSIIEKCSFGGAVQGSGYYAGGLVGLLYSSSTIENCSSKGSVTGGYWAGGLVGGASGISTASIVRSSSSSTVDCGIGAGGLAGVISGSNFISDSFSSGNVNGEAATGGLVAETRGSSSVRFSYSTSRVDGKQSVGGLIGQMHDSSYVSNSYSSGIVNGEKSVGGLVGRSSANNKITNNYALNSQVNGDTDVGRVVGLLLGASLSNNHANRAMRVTGGSVSAKSLSGIDGANISNSPYNAYKDWDQTLWEFPSSHNDHPTLRPDRIVLPNPDTTSAPSNTEASSDSPNDSSSSVTHVVDTSNHSSSNGKDITVKEYASNLNKKYKNEEIDRNQLVDEYIEGLIKYNDDTDDPSSKALRPDKASAAWVQLRGGDADGEASEAAKIIFDNLHYDDTEKNKDKTSLTPEEKKIAEANNKKTKKLNREIKILEKLYSDRGKSFDSEQFIDLFLDEDITTSDRVWRIIKNIEGDSTTSQKRINKIIYGDGANLFDEIYFDTDNSLVFLKQKDVKKIFNSYNKKSKLKELILNSDVNPADAQKEIINLKDDKSSSDYIRVHGDIYNYSTNKVAYLDGDSVVYKDIAELKNNFNEDLYIKQNSEMTKDALEGIYGKASEDVTAFRSFIKKDGSYKQVYSASDSLQCVALIKSVVYSVTDKAPSGSLGNGRYVYSEVGDKSHGLFGDGQDASSAVEPPKEGAVISFHRSNSKRVDTVGHVGIVRSQTELTDHPGVYKLEIFDQNDNPNNVVFIKLETKEILNDNGEKVTVDDGFITVADPETQKKSSLELSGWADPKDLSE